MSDPITPAGIAVALGKLLPSAVGAALSLRLNTADLSAGKRLVAFLGALALGHYLGAAVADQYALTGAKEEAARLLIALYGLNLIALISAQLPALLDTARRRILGDTP